MNDTPTMWQKFTNLPRWMQWAVIAAVSLITFLAYSDYVLVNADVWNTKADAIEARIKNAHNKGNRTRGIIGMSSLIRGLGPVEEPQKDIDDANAALTQTINTILKAHSVKEDFRASPPTRMPPQTLAKLTEGTGNRVESLSVELKFEANVQTAMAIISELESSPDIESISHVRLTKLSGAKKLSVRLTIDSWVYTSATRRGGGILQ
ncbi:MAG: hypothetical protein IH984_10015 [Planctomycetes bacterium]|nr:hypothetical protein [Planctomycetota bacterium]